MDKETLTTKLDELSILIHAQRFMGARIPERIYEIVEEMREVAANNGEGEEKR